MNTLVFKIPTTNAKYLQIFSLSKGISKVRIYMWIEGQDVDSLETVSSGLNLAVVINFFKDIAGYEYYND